MRRNVHLVVWGLVLATAVLAGCNSAWVSSGIIYRDQQNDWAKAEEMFKRAIDRSGGQEAIAWYELANTLVYRVENEHLANGEVDSARIKMDLAHEAYMKAVELNPEEYGYNPDAEDEADQYVVETAIQAAYAKFYNGGVQRMNSGRYDDAILWFEMAYRADPRGESGFDAEIIRAQLRYNQQVEDTSQDPDPEVLRAVLADLEALQVDPEWENSAKDKTDLVRVKVSVLRSLGREGEAAALYEELLAGDPDNLDLIRQVAAARENAGDREAAGDLYARAFMLSIGDPDVTEKERFSMGFLAVNSFQVAEAYEKLLDLFIRVEPYAITNTQKADLFSAKATAHYELEEFEQAIEAVQPVVQDGGYNPNSPRAWQIYYLSLNKVGRVEESQRARERFQALRDGA